ncbi:MAG: hypothetical protein ACLTMP_04560 [Eggerthella lenta]
MSAREALAALKTAQVEAIAWCGADLHRPVSRTAANEGRFFWRPRLRGGRARPAT